MAKTRENPCLGGYYICGLDNARKEGRRINKQLLSAL